MKIQMRRADPAQNMDRFYTVLIVPTLFGDWAVVREFGRRGQGGTIKDRAFATEGEAMAAAQELMRSKERRGYRLAGMPSSTAP